MKPSKHSIILGLTLLFFVGSVASVYAQSLETRVQALEDYVDAFQPALLELAESIEDGMNATRKEVLTALQISEGRVFMKVEDKLKEANTRKIIIDPSNQSFQGIQTNTGLLLVSVEGLQQGASGLQLVLNVGNPNYADFKGFKVRLVWGKRHYPAMMDYETWQKSLLGAEYTFDGLIEKGRWNQVIIDLDTSNTADLGYIECEFEILSVQLQS